MTLLDIPSFGHAVVGSIDAKGENDTIAQRLNDLGFVAGEPVRVVAQAPWGGDPILVQVGATRFALRRSEAQRVQVTEITA